MGLQPVEGQLQRVSTGAHLSQKNELNSAIFREGQQSLGAPRPTRAIVPEAQYKIGGLPVSPRILTPDSSIHLHARTEKEAEQIEGNLEL